MKKKYKILLIASAVFILIVINSCKQYKSDLEEYFSYWTSTSHITSDNIAILATKNAPFSKGRTVKGLFSLSSQKDQTIEFILHNPKNFKLRVKGNVKINVKDAKEDSDYKLFQDGAKLKLTFFKHFLQKYEQTKHIFDVSIQVQVEDGRKFGLYKLAPFQVNTPPPAPKKIFVAQTTTLPYKMVLCVVFDKNEIEKTYMLGSETKYYSGDISKLDVLNASKTESYNIELKTIAGKLVLKPVEYASTRNNGLINKVLVRKYLVELPKEKYVLYYNTNIRIGSGLNSYTFNSEDNKGLKSKPLSSKKESGLKLKSFYIRSSGNDDSLGLSDSPLKTLQATINKCTDSGTLYTIKILDNLSDTGACAVIDGDKKIRIESADGNKKRLDANSKGRVLEIKGGASVELKDLIITGGNATGNGGGILLSNNSSLSILNSKITNNTASANGGGIYIDSGECSLKGMDGKATSVKSNTGGAGSDVYINNGTLSLAGSLEFDTSKNIFLNNIDSNEPKINIKENLTAPNIAKVKPAKYKYMQVMSAEGSVDLNAQISKFECVDKGEANTKWGINSTGMLAVESINLQPEGGSAEITWKALKDAVTNASPGSTITINGEVKATDSSGNFGEITIDKDLTIVGGSGPTKDKLNANQSETTKTHRIFNIVDGGKLSLKNLLLIGSAERDVNGGAILLTGNSTLSTDTVVISYCKVYGNSMNGGAIYVNSTVTESKAVTLKNTKIDNCNAGYAMSGTTFIPTGNGGAIYIEKGSVLLQKGNTFELNEADKGGAIYIKNGSVVLKKGNIFKRNKADKGGAISIEAGSLTIEDYNDTKFTFNEADTRGGAIFIEKTAVVNIAGGVFNRNIVTSASSYLGHAIAVLGGTLNLSANARIYAYDSGSDDIYLANDKKKSIAKLNILGDLASSGEPIIDIIFSPGAFSHLGGYWAGRSVLTGDESLIKDNCNKIKVKGEYGSKVLWTVGEDGKLDATVNSGSGENAGKELRNIVKYAENDELILIGGDITLPTQESDPTKTSHIELDKKITLKGTSADISISGGALSGSIFTGGIIQVGNTGHLTIENLILKGGNASKGGAVSIYGGTFVLKSGIIESNYGDYGGAVFVVNSSGKIGKFIMKGGIIKLNKSDHGAIFCENGGQFIMRGGFIKGNKNYAGVSDGIGVKVQSGVCIKLSDNAQIGTYDVLGNLQDGNTVFVSKNCPIQIMGAFDSSFNSTNPVATIEVYDGSGYGQPNNYTTDMQVLKLGDEVQGVMLANEVDKFKVKMQTSPANQAWKVGPNGYLMKDD